jgi:hypothetical protein
VRSRASRCTRLLYLVNLTKYITLKEVAERVICHLERERLFAKAASKGSTNMMSELTPGSYRSPKSSRG